VAKAVEISIIIPAYNENDRLPRYVASILGYFDRRGTACEIIVVDDGSDDNTAAIVEAMMGADLRVKLVRLPRNRGKGYAVKVGMLRACGALRLFADADGSFPIGELERLERTIASGADIAIASRALHDASCSVKARLHRKVIGTIFNLIVRAFIVRGISDTQSGFKLFTAAAAMAVFPLLRIEGFGFDVEVIFLGRVRGYMVAEVPVNWVEVEGSKVKLARDSFRMFMDLLRIRVNNLRGYYRSGVSQ
jgi:dolichyl-phosphate beta-glucosyltransferase